MAGLEKGSGQPHFSMADSLLLRDLHVRFPRLVFLVERMRHCDARTTQKTLLRVLRVTETLAGDRGERTLHVYKFCNGVCLGCNGHEQLRERNWDISRCSRWQAAPALTC